MSDVLGIDATTAIALALRINFFEIHTNSEIFLSITLLFGRMLIFCEEISLNVMNRIILLPYQWEINAFGCESW